MIIKRYDRLFLQESPGAKADQDFLEDINPSSLSVLKAKAEPSLASSISGESFQFQRKGYYVKDKDSVGDKHIFNKTVSLRDNWKKNKNS